MLMKSIFDDTEVFNEAVEAPVHQKNFSDTYIYGYGNYEKELVEFVVMGTYLDKNNEGFKDLVADVKRQRISESLAKVLESNNTILVVGAKPMPRAFKAFVAKDMKGDKTSLKLYIDMTSLIDISGAKYEYKASHINVIISYLLSGMNSMIYYVQPSSIVNNSTILKYGCTCFASMVYYIIDYLRLSADANTRGRIMYLAAMYFQVNLLGKDENQSSVDSWALKTGGISSTDADMIMMRIRETKQPYANISTFIKALAEYLKAPKLTVDVFLDKWMYTFGSGTQFGLELYPSYAQILIYAYVGAYLNNQKTIEKIVGKPMVEFVTEVIKIGSKLI